MAQPIIGNIAGMEHIAGSQARLLSAYLTNYDTVFIVDDSATITFGEWVEIREALMGVAAEAARFDGNGVSVRFMNDPSLLDNTKSTKDINDLFMQVQPMGTAMISRKLLALINDHNERSLQAQKISLKALYDVKPLNIVVLTDGDFMETPAAIIRRIRPAIEVTRQIQTPQDVERRIGIQFVQIGDDAAATEALEALDNALPGDEDMIDTVRWEGKLTPERLYKILLGAVHSELDNTAATSTSTKRSTSQTTDIRVIDTDARLANLSLYSNSRDSTADTYSVIQSTSETYTNRVEAHNTSPALHSPASPPASSSDGYMAGAHTASRTVSQSTSDAYAALRSPASPPASSSDRYTAGARTTSPPVSQSTSDAYAALLAQQSAISHQNYTYLRSTSSDRASPAPSTASGELRRIASPSTATPPRIVSPVPAQVFLPTSPPRPASSVNELQFNQFATQSSATITTTTNSSGQTQQYGVLSSIESALTSPPVEKIDNYPTALQPNEYAIRVPSDKVAIVRARSHAYTPERVIVSTNPPRIGYPRVMLSEGGPSQMHLADGQGNSITVDGESWLTLSTEYGRLVGTALEWKPAPNKLLSQDGNSYRIGVNDGLLAGAQRDGDSEFGDVFVSVELVWA